MQVKCKQVTRAEDGRMSCAIVVRNRTENADTITQISLTRTRSCRPAPGEDDEQSEAVIESTRQVNVALSAGATWEGVLTWDEDAINWAQQLRSALILVEFARSKPVFSGVSVPNVPRGKNGGGRFKQRMQKIGWPLILLLLMFTTYSMVTRHQQQEDIAKVMQAMYIPPYPDGPMNSAESMLWRDLYPAYVTDDMDAESRAAAEAWLRTYVAGKFSQNESKLPDKKQTASPETGTNQRRTEALIDASANGQIKTVKQLLDKGADVNAKDKQGVAALMEATMMRHADIVKLLLDRGADVNAGGVDDYGRTPLLYASHAGYTDIVRLLIDKGVDMYGDEPALFVASGEGNIDIVKLLLEKGADVNAKTKDGSSALAAASFEGHAKIVTLLLDKNADVNAKNKEGVAALTYASTKGFTGIVRLLLNKGADVNAQGNSHDSWPALAAASGQGAIDIVKLLLEKGADVNAKSKAGLTALMAASANNVIEVMKLLLQQGANVNAQSSDGTTALMDASENRAMDAVKLLLDKGADVHAVNNDGRTALMIASKAGYADIVKLLQQQTANSINSPGKPPMSQE